MDAVGELAHRSGLYLPRTFGPANLDAQSQEAAPAATYAAAMANHAAQIVAFGGGGFSMEAGNPLLDDYVLA